jgi:hypothetical protein
MSSKSPPYAAEHERANAAFWELTPEQRIQRMREAGILGEDWPHLGDKVRVSGPALDWSYGVVVGADPNTGRVAVVHNTRDGGVVVSSLEDFAGDEAVEMVQRAPEGREHAVAAHAAELVGGTFDLAGFDSEELVRSSESASWSAQEVLASLLVALGLTAAAVALSRDALWAPSLGRYRDARGQATG